MKLITSCARERQEKTFSSYWKGNLLIGKGIFVIMFAYMSKILNE